MPPVTQSPEMAGKFYTCVCGARSDVKGVCPNPRCELMHTVPEPLTPKIMVERMEKIKSYAGEFGPLPMLIDLLIQFTKQCDEGEHG